MNDMWYHSSTFKANGTLSLINQVLSKLTKKNNFKENSNRKVPCQMTIAKAHESHCYIPDLVHTFCYVENGGLNLVLWLAKPLTCMT